MGFMRFCVGETLENQTKHEMETVFKFGLFGA